MSTNGSGSGFRLGVLLVIMALLGGALAYDMYNEVPFREMERDLDRLLALNRKDGMAADRSDVEAALKKSGGDSYKTKTNKYEVVHYNYYRTVPFIPGGKIYVVYDNNNKYIRTGIVTSAEKITEETLQGTLVSKELDPNAMPMMGLGGQVSTPQLPDAAKKKKESDEGKTDEGKTDEGKTDEGKTDEGKTDEGKTDEGKTDEGKTDEGKTDEGKTDEGKTDEGKTGEGKAGEGKI